MNTEMASKFYTSGRKKDNGHTSNLDSLESPSCCTKLISFGNDIIAGFACALLQFVFSMSYAAGTFASPRNSSLFGIGVMMTALSIILTQTSYSFTSQIPFLFISPDSFYPPLFLAISSQLSSQIQDDAVYQQTYLFALVIAVASVGISMWLVGRFGILKLMDFLPYPMVCGLMASVGVSLLQLSYTMSTRNEIRYFPVLVASIFTGCLQIVAQVYHFNPAMTFAAILVLGTLTFYFVLYFNKLSLEEAEEGNWVFGSKTSVDKLWIFWISEAHSFQSGGIDFAALWGLSGHFFGIAVLIIIKISLNVAAFEKSLRRRFDKSNEMCKYGLATFFSALCGAAGTSPSTSIMSVAIDMQGSEFVPNMIVAPALFLIWYLTHFSFVPYAPKFIFAGLLISSGLQMMVTWLVLPIYRIPFSEYMIVVVIVIVYNIFGMLQGLGVGCVLSMFLFAYKFHEVGCIRFISDLSMFRSPKERSIQHSKYLDENSSKICVIQLQGVLSFANVGQLFDLLTHHYFSLPDTMSAISCDEQDDYSHLSPKFKDPTDNDPDEEEGEEVLQYRRFTDASTDSSNRGSYQAAASPRFQPIKRQNSTLMDLYGYGYSGELKSTIQTVQDSLSRRNTRASSISVWPQELTRRADNNPTDSVSRKAQTTGRNTPVRKEDKLRTRQITPKTELQTRAVLLSPESTTASAGMDLKLRQQTPKTELLNSVTLTLAHPSVDESSLSESSKLLNGQCAPSTLYGNSAHSTLLSFPSPHSPSPGDTAEIQYGSSSSESDSDFDSDCDSAVTSPTTPPTHQTRPLAIILHCNMLLGLDASAIDMLDQVSILCRQHNCLLIFAAVGANERRALEAGHILDPIIGTSSDRHLPTDTHISCFTSLYTALAAAEDHLLATVSQDDLHSGAGASAGSSSPVSSRIPTLSLPARAGGFRYCIDMLGLRYDHVDVQSLRLFTDKCLTLTFKAGERIVVPSRPPLTPRHHHRSHHHQHHHHHHQRGLFFLESGYILCEEKKYWKNFHGRSSGDVLDRDSNISAAADDHSAFHIDVQHESINNSSASSSNKHVAKSNLFSWDMLAPVRTTVEDELARIRLSHVDHNVGLGDVTQHGPGWVFGQLSAAEHLHVQPSTPTSTSANIRTPGGDGTKASAAHHDIDLLLEGHYYVAETDIKVLGSFLTIAVKQL